MEVARHTPFGTSRLMCFGVIVSVAIGFRRCKSYGYDLHFDDVVVYGQASRASIRISGARNLAGLFLKFPGGKIKRCSEITPSDVAEFFPHPSHLTIQGSMKTFARFSYHSAFEFDDNRLATMEIGGTKGFGLGRSDAGPFATEPFDTSSDPRIIEALGLPKRTVWRERSGI